LAFGRDLPTADMLRLTTKGLCSPMDNDDKRPSAPFTALAAGMVQLHETFKAAVDAGFTEDQAMQIVLAMLGSATSPGS
jgi:hypothetical protein